MTNSTRLKNTDVLLRAIEDGIKNPQWHLFTFAYADSYDAQRQLYIGLKPQRPGEGQPLTALLNASSVLVKPEVALAQFAAEAEAQARAQEQKRLAEQRVEYTPPQPAIASKMPSTSGTPFTPVSLPTTQPQQMPVVVEKAKTRFHGTIKLNPSQTVKPVQTIAAEVLQHLSSLYGCKVEVTLEIHAEFPEGFPEDIQRIIKENCATLKFEKDTDFEET